MNQIDIPLIVMLVIGTMVVCSCGCCLLFGMGALALNGGAILDEFPGAFSSLCVGGIALVGVGFLFAVAVRALNGGFK